MSAPTTTLNSFLDTLSSAPDSDLVFIIDGSPIQPNYHVTEVKFAKIYSMDCGQRIADWVEITIPLFDGPQTVNENCQFMKVAKFQMIVRAALAGLTQSGDDQMFFEYATANQTAGKCVIDRVTQSHDQTLVTLSGVSIVCKPIEMSKTQEHACCPR